MTLTTHAIVGAATASLIPSHPALGFVASFASHFLVDAIPHWHYPLATLKVDKNDQMNSDMIINKQFFWDILKIGFDAILGIALSFILFWPSYPQSFFYILFGAAGGIVPDALQFLYWKWRHQPLTALQQFHLWIHAKRDLDGKPVVGILLQIFIILLSVVIVNLHILG